MEQFDLIPPLMLTVTVNYYTLNKLYEYGHVLTKNLQVLGYGFTGKVCIYFPLSVFLHSNFTFPINSMANYFK